MTFPQTDLLSLIPEVLQLNMVITKGGGWSLALNVKDPTTGAGLDLTGKTAKIVLPDSTAWTATIAGSQFRWDIPKSTVDAVAFQSGIGMLTVTDATNTVVWAKGRVTVQ